MKAYVIRPTVEAFDGSGRLSGEASRALDMIADMVADSLCAGGDNSHQAAVWDSPQIFVDTPPAILAMHERQDIVSLARTMLDPNDYVGGDIRSATNCRVATFGQDGQALLCLRQDDAVPVAPDPALATVTEEPGWLSQSDLFDGSWPASRRP
jgi:hypothetical protein